MGNQVSSLDAYNLNGTGYCLQQLPLIQTPETPLPTTASTSSSPDPVSVSSCRHNSFRIELVNNTDAFQFRSPGTTMCIAASASTEPAPLIWSPCSIQDTTQRFFEKPHSSATENTAQYWYAADTSKAIGLNPNMYADNWNDLFLTDVSSAAVFAVVNPDVMRNLTLNIPLTIESKFNELLPAVPPMLLDPPTLTVSVMSEGPVVLEDASCAMIVSQTPLVNASSLWSYYPIYGGTPKFGLEQVYDEDPFYDYRQFSSFQIDSAYKANNTYKLRVKDKCAAFNGSYLNMDPCAPAVESQLLTIDCYRTELASSTSPLNCRFQSRGKCLASDPNGGRPVPIVLDSTCTRNFTIIQAASNCWPLPKVTKPAVDCPSNKPAACGTVCFSPTQSVCSSDNIVCPSTSPNTCGGICFSPSEAECKNGKIVYFQTSTSSTSTATSSTPTPVTNCGSGLIACGPACYDPKQLSCSDGLLCPNSAPLNCGGACYNPVQNSCKNGALGPPVATVTTASSAPTQTPGVTCGAGLSVCGKGCYDPKQSTCSDGVACPNANPLNCGGACYNPAQNSCQNGALGPPIATATSSSVSTQTPGVACGPGLSACGKGCYDPKQSNCSDGVACPNANPLNCNGACYNPTQNSCKNGALGPPIATVTSTSVSSVTATPIVNCGTGFVACGPACYDPKQLSCSDGLLCPMSAPLNCNGACYNSAQNSCKNGALGPPIVTATTTSGSTQTPIVTCGTGLSVCGKGCYDPTQTTCNDGVACPNSNPLNCNGACYNATQNSCKNGALGPPAGATVSCGNGLLVCGNACYDPLRQTCSAGLACLKEVPLNCSGACYNVSKNSCNNGVLGPP
ncbi:hypothetical protein HDU81_007280 [Chytriomyces hyalinus]|nr:hypothetical protein HDU81_007280 [Chytriomyces hyalinus]